LRPAERELAPGPAYYFPEELRHIFLNDFVSSNDSCEVIAEKKKKGNNDPRGVEQVSVLGGPLVLNGAV